MVVTIKWNFNLQVDGGPSLPLADQFQAEAYDKISVTIKDDDTDKVVEVQPGGLGDVEFLCVKSNVYQTDTNKKLFYKVGNSNDEITLERAHVLIGSSLVSLLGEAPNTLKFSNSIGSDANIEILIGRRALS